MLNPPIIYTNISDSIKLVDKLEADEPEALCLYLDQLADAARINILDHGDGIADHWRDW